MVEEQSEQVGEVEVERMRKRKGTPRHLVLIEGVGLTISFCRLIWNKYDHFPTCSSIYNMILKYGD